MVSCRYSPKEITKYTTLDNFPRFMQGGYYGCDYSAQKSKEKDRGVKMKYEYIIDKRGAYVVPWADTPESKDKRDQHFSEAFGVRPLIVSPDFWEYLTSSYKVQVLTGEEK